MEPFFWRPSNQAYQLKGCIGRVSLPLYDLLLPRMSTLWTQHKHYVLLTQHSPSICKLTPSRSGRAEKYQFAMTRKKLHQKPTLLGPPPRGRGRGGAACFGPRDDQRCEGLSTNQILYRVFRKISFERYKTISRL